MKQFGEDNNWIVGKHGESIFEHYMFKKNKQFKVIKSTLEDDKNGIDYYIVDITNNKKYSVDIKSKHSTKLVVETWINYNKGWRGWLYKNADYIVFHVTDKNEMLWINKSVIRSFIESGITDGSLNEIICKGNRDGERIVVVSYDSLLSICGLRDTI